MSLGFVPRASTADFVVGFEAGVVDLVDSIGGGLKSSVTVSSTAAGKLESCHRAEMHVFFHVLLLLLFPGLPGQ